VTDEFGDATDLFRHVVQEPMVVTSIWNLTLYNKDMINKTKLILFNNVSISIWADSRGGPEKQELKKSYTQLDMCCIASRIYFRLKMNCFALSLVKHSTLL